MVRPPIGFKFVCTLGALMLLAACGGNSGGSNTQEPTQEQQDTTRLRAVVANNLSGDPAGGRALPSINDPLAQLGLPGQADLKALNLVQAQALFPVTSQEEMRAQFMAGVSDNNQVRDALAQRLVDQSTPNTWLNEFQTGFNTMGDAETLITYQNIAIAIAEYERSQVFTNTPWRDFVNGDDKAISTEAKRGALLFFTSVNDGGAGCSDCHSGDFFTDENFHVLAVPQIGRGKKNGPIGDDDFGRFSVSLHSEDRYAFRTPNLLNITETGHSGAYMSLREIVVHHLNPEQAIANYDFNLITLDLGIQKTNAAANTQQALIQLQSLRNQGKSLLRNVDLSDAEIDQLLTFTADIFSNLN